MFHPFRPALFLLVAVPALAAAAEPQGVDLRFEVRVLGERIGTARLQVGKRAGRRRLQPVTFSADVRPMGIGVLRMAGEATTRVRPGGELFDAVWDWQELTSKSRVRATWRGATLDGRYYLDGTERKHTIRKVGGSFTDVVTIFPWMMAQRYKPGAVLRTTTFTGNQIYDVRAVVEGAEEIILPSGSRATWRLTFTAVRPGKTRHVIVWVDRKTRVPCRVRVDYPVLGDVEAVLIRSEKSGPPT